jgi:hypothetical protein
VREIHCPFGKGFIQLLGKVGGFLEEGLDPGLESLPDHGRVGALPGEGSGNTEGLSGS